MDKIEELNLKPEDLYDKIADKMQNPSELF